MLTTQDIQKALPANLKNTATQQLADTLNNVSKDPLIAEEIRNNFISYTTVLQEGRFKIQDYLNAVTYITHKLMGNTNQDAYYKTFPQRYADLVAKGTSTKDIASYVSAYNKNKLVNLIAEQSLIPVWILNREIYQRAINVQADLMLNANSEKVRTDAANSLLTHLAKPKEAVPLVNIDMTESSGLNELKNTLRDLAEQQQSLINQGISTKEITEYRLIDGVKADD